MSSAPDPDPRPHASRTWAIVPIRVTQLDHDLGVWRRRTVAYRGVCGCGEKLPACGSYAEARADLIEHLREPTAHA